METLAPRALYDNDDLGITARLPLYSGVVFGFGMFLFDFIRTMSEGVGLAAALPRPLIIGVISGAAFGILFPRTLGRMGRRFQDQLYAGGPDIVPTPPPGYPYRLPCSWMRSAYEAVGGVLYLGPRGLRFDSHLRTPARLRATVVAEPLEALTIEVVEAALPAIARIWGRRSVPRLQVRWDGQKADFTIPAANETGRVLKDRIETLRTGLDPRAPSTPVV